jgi:hypothetical protein
MSKKGIDVRLALEILSARASSEEEHQENHHACQHADISEVTKGMGQVIELDKSNGDDDSDPTTTIADFDDRQKQLQAERDERRAAIQEKLQSMTITDLLGTVLEMQQQRVQTYRTYDR